MASCWSMGKYGGGAAARTSSSSITGCARGRRAGLLRSGAAWPDRRRAHDQNEGGDRDGQVSTCMGSSGGDDLRDVWSLWRRRKQPRYSICLQFHGRVERFRQVSCRRSRKRTATSAKSRLGFEMECFLSRTSSVGVGASVLTTKRLCASAVLEGGFCGGS